MSERKPRYEVVPIEKPRTPYRFQVVDLAFSAKIVARTAAKETAEEIARQLNKKGFVEMVP